MRLLNPTKVRAAIPWLALVRTQIPQDRTVWAYVVCIGRRVVLVVALGGPGKTPVILDMHWLGDRSYVRAIAGNMDSIPLLTSSLYSKFRDLVWRVSDSLAHGYRYGNEGLAAVRL